jgi:hypothetical protein
MPFEMKEYEGFKPDPKKKPKKETKEPKKDDSK